MQALNRVLFKSISVLVGIICVLAILVIMGANSCISDPTKMEPRTYASSQEQEAVEMGYTNFDEYLQAIEAVKEEGLAKASELEVAYPQGISDEQMIIISDIKNTLQTLDMLSVGNEALKTLNTIEPGICAKHKAKVSAVKKAPKRSYSSQSSSSSSSSWSPSTPEGGYSGAYFRQIGEIYENDYRYTWYPSSAGRHWRINEWHTDEQGIYRDKDGYVVVAAYDGDEDPEAIVPTPFGEGKKYDNGCNPGTLDIYVNW